MLLRTRSKTQKEIADMGYDVLAEFYDQLNDSVEYGAWAREISDFLANRIVSTPSRILDVACGTGKMTLELSRLGHSLAGVDLSSEMLSLAQKNCADEGFYPLFVCQDMTALSLGECFDAAVCCLDSVNYISSKEALDSFFARVFEHLVSGGYLFFDVNTEYKFENVYKNNSYVYDEKDVFCVWQNFYSSRRRLCDFDLTFFVKNGDGSYTRLEETQREYLYTDSELTELLEKNGFEVCMIRADFDFSQKEGIYVAECDERHYFVARKK